MNRDKKRRVVITGPAERDTLANYDWWAKNRSAEQAICWLEGIYATIFGLATTADRHALATETELRKIRIKQAFFGLGRKPTHRILFSIEEQRVIVYRVRAFKQDRLGVDGLDG